MKQNCIAAITLAVIGLSTLISQADDLSPHATASLVDDSPVEPAPAACSCIVPVACRSWTATADAIFLERRDPAAVVLAVNTVDPTQNLNAADFGFDFHAGYEISLAKHFACNAVEFRFFAIDQWDSPLNVATTPANLLRVNAAVPIFTFTGDAISADYRSQLYNAELNGRHEIKDWFEGLLGFRYVELDERGSASLLNAAVPFGYTVATRNRLYGLQAGGNAVLWSNRTNLQVDVGGKAGVFGNQAAQDSVATTGLVALPATGRGDRTSFLGELGVTGTYRFNECLSVRAGYRALWVTNVALASEQLGATDFANNTGFNGTGDVFYHGGFVGIELAR